MRDDLGRLSAARAMTAEFAARAVAHHASAERIGPDGAPGRPLHILLVDDDLLVRGGTAEMLDDAGHQVVETGSAAEALSVLAQGSRFDLLITDNCMPGMDGTDLIALVREQLPDMPILLITGYATRGARIGAHVNLLPKPFRQAGLLAAVSALTE